MANLFSGVKSKGDIKWSQNPLFQRGVALSGPLHKRILRPVSICVALGICWFVIIAIAVGVTLLDAPSSLEFGPLWGLIGGASLFLNPFVTYPLGLIITWVQISRDRKHRLYEQIYFTALNSREIVWSRLLSIVFPLLGLVFWMSLCLGLGGLVAIFFQVVIPSLKSLKSSNVSQVESLFSFYALFTQIGGSALGIFAGAIGGLRLGIIAKPGNYFSEIFLQLLVFCIVITLSCMCGLLSGIAILIHIHSYQRVVNEFWWHTVFLEQERKTRTSQFER